MLLIYLGIMLKNVMYLWMRLSIYCVLTLKWLISLALCLLFMENWCFDLSPQHCVSLILFALGLVNTRSFVLGWVEEGVLYINYHYPFWCTRTIGQKFGGEKLKSCGPHPFWVSLLSFFVCQTQEVLTFSYTSLFPYSLFSDSLMPNTVLRKQSTYPNFTQNIFLSLLFMC